jgi:nitrate reductase gamma subunit/ferredoxin
MADTYVIEPDLDFIKKVGALGGEDLKKCYQCATCSVACPISPDTKPFPRKEMIAASWGLKDKLVGNSDIWLCHNCGDCSTRCPREAKPADVLAAVRAYTIEDYAQPKVLARAMKDPKKLPILLAIPAVLFTENNDRQTAHFLTLYGFVGLFVVTNILFVVMYGSYLLPGGALHGPWSQLNPVKWLANIAGVALIVGTGLMIKNRISKKDQTSGYFDWYLIYLAFGLGVTGMGAQLTRLAGWAAVSFTTYYVHLILVWALFAYLPFSKLAHLVYRTVAMAYNEYAGRNF